MMMTRAAALLALLLWPAAAAAQTVIVIDPGHGGGDPGGVGNGLQEKAIVLDVGLRFKQLLDADSSDPGGGGDWVALMTRSNDTFVSLSARAAFANAEGADRFMSIHSNAFGSSQANGTETFSFAEGSTGANMRNLVQEEMIAAWGRTNRGNKTANFAVLRETAMPAELHELAFITNAGDAAFLASPTERQRAAEAHLRAIQRHFGIDPYMPGLGPSGAAGDIAGTVVDDAGPVAGARVSVDTGQKTVSVDDGGFSLAEIPAGTRTLTVSADGYSDSTVEVQVGAGQLSEQQVLLERSGSAGGDDGEQDDGGDGDGDGDDGGGGAIDPDDEAASGCGCRARASGSTPLGGALTPLLIALAVLVVRRRR
ncbi:MAG TPA: N-acetylmuramoyl-L-alanine amidase [Kofleriaceae bacterium]|nr:N-acetylmuramoyl-L-alanine amidase [Kofleriaceae bacterium]